MADGVVKVESLLGEQCGLAVLKYCKNERLNSFVYVVRGFSYNTEIVQKINF